MSWSVVMMEEPVTEISLLNRIWYCVQWVVLTVLKGASWAIHSVTQHHIVSPKKHHSENLKSWTNNCWARDHAFFHTSSIFLHSNHYWLFGVMWTNMVLLCCNLLIDLHILEWPPLSVSSIFSQPPMNCSYHSKVLDFFIVSVPYTRDIAGFIQFHTKINVNFLF